PPAVEFDPVPTWHAALLSHHVEPERGVFTHAVVPVRAGPLVLSAAVGDRAGQAAAQLRLFAGHIDRAGGCGATVVGAGRTFGYFDLLDIEHVPGDRAQVAHAIDENAAGGIKPAHVDAVAGAGVAVLADIERAHARAVAQRLGQGGGALL